MCVYVCMCVCMCICVYVSVYVCCVSVCVMGGGRGIALGVPRSAIAKSNQYTLRHVYWLLILWGKVNIEDPHRTHHFPPTLPTLPTPTHTNAQTNNRRVTKDVSVSDNMVLSQKAFCGPRFRHVTNLNTSSKYVIMKLGGFEVYSNYWNLSNYILIYLIAWPTNEYQVICGFFQGESKTRPFWV